MPQTKPDVTLSDGRTVVFDFNAVTIREWRSLFDTKQPDDEEYRIVGKMIGLEMEEIAAFGFQDWTKVIKTMRAKARELNTNPT